MVDLKRRIETIAVYTQNTHEIERVTLNETTSDKKS